jgi:F-box and WD-40 domain protein CDC4
MQLNFKRQAELSDFAKKLNKSEVRFLLGQLLNRSRQISAETTISTLAPEIMVYIFIFLTNESDPKILTTCARVCKTWKSILQDDLLWRQACKNKLYQTVSKRISLAFGKKSTLQKALTLAPWKSVYKQNYLTWKNWVLGNYKVSNLSKHSGYLSMTFDEQFALCVKQAGNPGLLRNICTGDSHVQIDQSESAMTTVKFDDCYLVAGFRNGIIRVWEIKMKSLLIELVGHQEEVGALSLYGSTLASGSEDNSIKVWNIKNGVCITTLTGHEGAVTCLQLSQNTLVSGSSDSTIKVWNLTTGNSITLKGHEGSVFCIQFNDSFIFSGGLDSSIIMWSLKSGKRLRTFKGHHHAVVCIQFDESKVVSGSGNSKF